MPSTVTVAAGCFAGLWVGAALLCSPTLLSANCRRLIDAGPVDGAAANYLAGVGALALAHVALVFAGEVANRAVRVDAVGWFLGVTLLVAVVGWTLLGVALPRAGRWDPAGPGLDGRLVLAAAAGWYAASSVGLAGVFAFAWFLVNYPG